MEFEFDPRKSQKNKEMHGIDFVEAQYLWEDEDRLEIPTRSDDAPRFALLALYQRDVWTAFFTYRAARVRLISVRRAREKEEALYYES